MWHRFSRNVLNSVTALLALALVLPPPAHAADRPAPLAGTWLIAAESFDHWLLIDGVGRGFPVLVISAEGRFGLYLHYPACILQDAQGEVRRPPTAEAERELKGECARRRAVWAKRGLAPFAFLAARGTWKPLGAKRVEFSVSERGLVPRAHRALLRRIRESGKARLVRPPEPTRPQKARIARDFKLARAQFETFYGDFFILGAGVLEYRLDGRALRLTALSGDRSVTWRRMDPVKLQRAMALVDDLNLPVNRAYRCIVRAVDGGLPAAKGAMVVAFLRLHDRRRTLMSWLRSKTPETLPADQKKVYAARSKAWSDTVAAIEEHAISTARDEGKLGAWLGCPRLDRQP